MAQKKPRLLDEALKIKDRQRPRLAALLGAGLPAGARAFTPAGRLTLPGVILVPSALVPTKRLAESGLAGLSR